MLVTALEAPKVVQIRHLDAAPRIVTAIIGHIPRFRRVGRLGLRTK